MTTNYHTPVASGAAANAATINSPLGQLDAAITAGLGGVNLTNKSGGALATNDCVVVDDGNDESVTTTTTAGDTDRPGIVLDGGAADAEVTISFLGEATVVVDGAGTRGQWIKTSTTAKQVTPTSTLDVGVFGLLTNDSAGGAGTTATAILLGMIVTDVATHNHAASDINSGQLALDYGGTGADLSAASPGFVKLAVPGSLSTAALAAVDMPSGINAAKISAGNVSDAEFDHLNGVINPIQAQIDGKSDTSHAGDHETDGIDPFTVSHLLDAIARSQILLAGVSAGSRRKINFVEGSNVSIDVTDDGDGDEQVSIEISAAGGSLGTDELVKVGAGGTADYLNSTHFSRDTTDHILVSGNILPQLCQGRLTLITGSPVTTSDVTGASTIYFTPCQGNMVALYNGSDWNLYEFTEVSLALSGLTTDTNYDVFLYDSSGTLTLELTGWTNNTNRATAITLQDGVYVKSGATTRRYLGTIRTTGTTTTEDSEAKRFVWNMYNRRRRPLLVTDDTNSWTYATASWRAWNNSNSNRVEFVRGVNEDPVYLRFDTLAEGPGSSGYGLIGIGVDSTSANSATLSALFTGTQSPNTETLSAQYHELLSVGYHYLQLLEYVSNTSTYTFYGDSGVEAPTGGFGYVLG